MAIDCYCDYDAPSVYSAKSVKARKEHRCEECGRTIRVGETYHYVFGVWDGDPCAFYTCSDCREIEQFVRINIPCFCYGAGNLITDAKDIIQRAYEEAADEVQGLWFGFGRLLVKAKRARAAV